MRCITYFPTRPNVDAIPAVLPSPFADQPHPLAQQACQMLQQRLAVSERWGRDFFAPNSGKMFGVLVVRDAAGQVGFLSAFSGMMNGQWLLAGFVPPIFDVSKQAHYLQVGKKELAQLAEQLEDLENSIQRAELMQEIALLQVQREQDLAALKQRHKAAKTQRKQQRLLLQQLHNVGEQQTQLAQLALASQHDKREAANLVLAWDERLQQLQHPLDVIEQQISQIKAARAALSRDLHQQVFASYVLKNFLHEQSPITEFFADATPPAGAGDCAAPKLLHYAYLHQLQPLALAEFWWGASHAADIRHHGQFYPACRGKCRPILPFMLRGLAVEPEPNYHTDIDVNEPVVIYEDEVLLVVNKPAGLMSEPGKEVKDSVFYRLLQRYPSCPELRLVHRLDMATSGLLLVAKTQHAYRLLQKQFIQRSVEKRYEALLSKRLMFASNEGDISLPLRVDFDDRPRQLVCYEYGKPALTHWQIIAYEGENTRVYFYPHTGRTHQLRVHASHRDGLNAAIVGDDLYGQAADRLMLHAQRLCFSHPQSRARLEFELPAPF